MVEIEPATLAQIRADLEARRLKARAKEKRKLENRKARIKEIVDAGYPDDPYVQHYRKKDRDKERKKQIIAIDGEGKNDPDGKHRYTLLAASNGSYIAAHDLGTAKCFRFLTDLPQNALIVGFSINYDICMMLRDATEKQLRELWKGYYVAIRGFQVRYTPSRELIVKDTETGRRAHVYDVFGFFQRSFVSALNEWDIGTIEQRERIAEMKDRRGDFAHENDNDILVYCQEECALLVDMVTRLRDRCYAANLYPKHWYGAGALAAALLSRQNIKMYMPTDSTYGPRQELQCIRAYYGGRFELSRLGEFGDVYGYDINSAYPYAAASLPCLHHAHFTDTDWAAARGYGIYRVRWNVPSSVPFGPFPFRKDGNIWYPYCGEGYYHEIEIRAAMRLHGEEYFTVLDGMRLDVDCDHKPFAFIPELYSYRRQLKRNGDRAEHAIKLAINSVYGKLAQMVGWQNRKPPYQQHFWAGLITATCRAMLLDAVRLNPSAVFALATDGILSSEPLDLETGNGLGNWEYQHYDYVFAVQPGVYEQHTDGKVITKTRGFSKAESNFYAMRARFMIDGLMGKYTSKVTRFIGLGSALMRNDLSVFRTWVTSTRDVTFWPNRRTPSLLQGSCIPLATVPPPPGATVSEPYVKTDLWKSHQEGEDPDELRAALEQP